MTTFDRTEHVAGLVEELRPHIHHAFGLTVISDQVRDEICAFITLMETEIAGRSRGITALLAAYRELLSENRGRIHATDHSDSIGHLLHLKSEVDLTTAAELTGLNPDTLRRAAREKRIEGRMQSNRWLLDVASVEAYKARRAS
jgi:hypothetical protein